MDGSDPSDPPPFGDYNYTNPVTSSTHSASYTSAAYGPSTGHGYPVYPQYTNAYSMPSAPYGSATTAIGGFGQPDPALGLIPTCPTGSQQPVEALVSGSDGSEQVTQPLTTSVSTEPKKSRNNCNHCAKRGRPCSRDLPECQQCLTNSMREWRGLVCSYAPSKKSKKDLAEPRSSAGVTKKSRPKGQASSKQAAPSDTSAPDSIPARTGANAPRTWDSVLTSYQRTAGKKAGEDFYAGEDQDLYFKGFASSSRGEEQNPGD